MGKYRTYIRVFRVKPEISSMGLGPKRVRLPLGATITLDILFVFTVTFPVAYVLIAPLLALIIQVPSGWYVYAKIVYAIVTAGTAAFFSRKFEPSGKTIYKFSLDLLNYALRSKWHNGWKSVEVDLYDGAGAEVGVSQVNGNECGTLPAFGFVEAFELKAPTAVKIQGKRLIFSKNGERLPAGQYQFMDGKITMRPRSTPPKIRKAPSLRRKGG